jgi:hypothetical protein
MIPVAAKSNAVFARLDLGLTGRSSKYGVSKYWITRFRG